MQDFHSASELVNVVVLNFQYAFFSKINVDHLLTTQINTMVDFPSVYTLSDQINKIIGLELCWSRLNADWILLTVTMFDGAKLAEMQ